MKAVSARRRGALWQNILRGVLLSAAVTVLLVCGLIKLNEKKKQLEKDSQLFE